MKKIIFFLLILFQFNISYCCSILCGAPKKFNTTVYILEGTVTGHAGNFNHKNILGEFALLQIKISKTFYSPKVVDEINLIILGLSSDCRDTGEPLEEMKKSYPVGTIVSFFAFESDLVNNEDINLSLCVCCSMFKNGYKSRIPYDYESQKKAFAELYRRKQKEYNTTKFDAEYFSEKEVLTNEYDDFLQNRHNNIVSQGFQVHLDLLMIYKSKSEKKKFRILNKLIWSDYIENSDFIKEQDINEKMKLKLISQYETIQKDWRTH